MFAISRIIETIDGVALTCLKGFITLNSKLDGVKLKLEYPSYKKISTSEKLPF
jgi:hypothetical protein